MSESETTAKAPEHRAIAEVRQAHEMAVGMFHPDVAALIQHDLAGAWDRMEAGEPAWYDRNVRAVKAARRLIEGVACVAQREPEYEAAR